MDPARFVAQLLAGTPAATPDEVVQRLLAVQAQDPRGARLTIRSRSRGLVGADVDRALTVDRSVVVTWLNRGTLHLVGREDYPWLHALTAPTIISGNARRLAQEGMSAGAAERGVKVIVRALESNGPMGRAGLRDCLDAAGVPTAGQALVHLLLAATLRGSIVRGPMVGGDQAFVLVRDWLGAPVPVDRSSALAELARRYLAGHGPADDRDLAKWSGLPLGEVRHGLAAVSGELRQHPDGTVSLSRQKRSEVVPAPRLLGPFDPLLLGWRDRTAIVGPHDLVTTNGIFRPFALVDGSAVGIWRLAGGSVALDLASPVAAATRKALDAEARDILRFLDLPDRRPALSLSVGGRARPRR